LIFSFIGGNFPTLEKGRGYLFSGKSRTKATWMKEHEAQLDRLNTQGRGVKAKALILLPPPAYQETGSPSKAPLQEKG
jgi:hypothetical protein